MGSILNCSSASLQLSLQGIQSTIITRQSVALHRLSPRNLALPNSATPNSVLRQSSNQSSNQSINQSILRQSINPKALNQSINQSINQSTNHHSSKPWVGISRNSYNPPHLRSLSRVYPASYKTILHRRRACPSFAANWLRVFLLQGSSSSCFRSALCRRTSLSRWPSLSVSAAQLRQDPSCGFAWEGGRAPAFASSRGPRARAPCRRRAKPRDPRDAWLPACQNDKSKRLQTSQASSSELRTRASRSRADGQSIARSWLQQQARP